MKSQHGYRRLDQLLPTCIIYGVGEISVYQLKDVFTAQQFVPFYFTAVKHDR
ncbi:unnamed protein product [Schistosoma margrebowiei]|uniref:Uncharacterized protein n=1 Tax=Schistosoma margrebowiei TaxID=48269 RepID=A0A3P8GK71_9TREM|nr:unnamed protein product [Schistosoma margrebowiei]